MITFRKVDLRDPSGVAGIEFALISPVMIVMFLGIVCYGAVGATYVGTEELVAQAARASVAGLSDAERHQIVSGYVSQNAAQYSFLDPTKISVSAAPVSGYPTAYQVTLSYDMSGSFAYSLSNLIPLPSPNIQVSTVVLNGGA